MGRGCKLVIPKGVFGIPWIIYSMRLKYVDLLSLFLVHMSFPFSLVYTPSLWNLCFRILFMYLD